MASASTNPDKGTSHAIECHYDVLKVPRDADATAIKKAHRKLALQYHPDKNNTADDSTTYRFRLIQQAYECLSDPAERKWYDQHRDAILKGWSADTANDADGLDILFDVVPFQHPSCYDGYRDDDEHSFYEVYRMVFEQVYRGEQEGWISEGNIEDMPMHDLPIDFGDGTTQWSNVAAFYKSWESFASCLSFAWADMYDPKEAPNRRVKRAMDDENKKKRRVARRERNEDVLALVHFVKRRDPRVKAHYVRVEEEKRQREKEQVEATKLKKTQAHEKREAWRADAERTMAELEEEDRLAGRVRLADLEDDYEYGGGKRGKKGRKKGKKPAAVKSENGGNTSLHGPADKNDDGDDPHADGKQSEIESIPPHSVSSDGETTLSDTELRVEYESEYSEESETSEPDVWRCECCRKEFKSEGQMENHLKSKKHKDALKKYEKKRQKEENINGLLNELALDP